MPLSPQALALLASKLGGSPQGALQPGQTQPAGMLPAPAPQPTANYPDQVPVGNPAPVDTTSPDVVGQQGLTGQPTSPFGLLPKRNGDMFNPPFTGAEPTAEPNGNSPPVNNVGRTPLGALLIPPTIMQMIQGIRER